MTAKPTTSQASATSTSTKPSRAHIREVVAGIVLESLDKRSIPWRRPWSSALGPRNAFGRNYRGVNIMLLLQTALGKSYSDNVWITYNQAKKLGGNVKRGEKSTPVVFWTIFKKRQADGTEATIPLQRWYYVFNTDQCEGLQGRKLGGKVSDKQPERTLDRSELALDQRCDKVLENLRAQGKLCKLTESKASSEAFYSPDGDNIVVPSRDQFANREAFWATLFHEVGHSTGHKSRLNREKMGDGHGFASYSYSVEELVAEFTTMFVGAELGFGTTEVREGELDVGLNNVAYCQHWASKISKDRAMVLRAIQAAQKAADFILTGDDANNTETDENGAISVEPTGDEPSLSDTNG